MLPAWMINDLRKKDREEDATVSLYDNPRNHSHDNRDSGDGDSSDEVLNAGSGGGGHPPPPPPPDPMAEARAQMTLEAERERVSEAKAEREAEKKASQLESDTAAFQGRLGSAYLGAQNYGSARLRNLGIDDQYGIMPAYETALQRARSSVPNLDPNPGNYFGNDIFENALGEARSGQRTKLTKGYESEVPQGFEQTYIPDTADDALINAIIGEQFGEAGEYIDRARARGTLNEAGYTTASRALGQQRSGATARANELGLGVLETGRQSLRDIDKQARQGITNWDFGDVYDPSSYSSRIKTGATGFTGGLEGKLRNAFGSTEFFDPDALIAKGGKAQGAINPGSAALQDAISEEERRRTAGSVGAF